MSIDKITKLAASLAKQADNQEKFLAPVLASKLNKASEVYPNDPTIIGLTRVINKYADKNTFISRGEIKDLYQKFYSRNNKFAEIFSEELGESEQLASPKFAHREQEATEVKTDYLADQVLSNALESVFNAAVPLKMYAKDTADKAKKAVASTLSAWNLSPSNIEVEAGSDKFIVVKANYETPKGVTGVYIPVQVAEHKIAAPSVFIGNGNPQDLNHSNIKKYITASAGLKLKISAENVLTALTKAASEDREISDTELALARLNASRRQQQEFFSNQILDQKVEKEVKEIQLPKYSEFSHLEEKFASPYGIASFNLGEDKVNTGREIIARNLASFGAKNPQITVVDSNKNTITYAVSLNSGKVAFKVPVKIEDNRINPPTVMLCQGTVTSFDAAGVNKLFVQNMTDYKAAAAASAQYGLKSSELVDNIRQAMQENNLAKAEDALNVLAENGDSKAYASGFQVYAAGLKGENRSDDITNHPLYNPNDFYTTSASKVAISKQTGLPINKIYIDENGNHRPIYRRGMQENYQGGFFMNYKIFG